MCKTYKIIHKLIKRLLLILVLLLLNCKEDLNFSFKLLNDNNDKLTDSSKVYLKHYFGEINYENAKKGLYLNICPKKDTSYSAKLEEALNPKSLPKHLKVKNITYENSSNIFEVIDTSYFEMIPTKSLIQSSKDYYNKKDSLANIQFQNSSNIDKIVNLSFNVKDFIKIRGNYLELNFGVENMGSKPITEIYGIIGLKDNYGNLVMSSKYSFENKIYRPLSLEDFETVIEQNNWYNSVRIGKTVDDLLIRKIKNKGKENFILSFTPTRINFTDGTYLIGNN